MIPLTSTSHQAQSERGRGGRKQIRRNWAEEAGHKKQNGKDAANIHSVINNSTSAYVRLSVWILSMLS
jgi:hypothetical protein